MTDKKGPLTEAYEDVVVGFFNSAAQGDKPVSEEFQHMFRTIFTIGAVAGVSMVTEMLSGDHNPEHMMMLLEDGKLFLELQAKMGEHLREHDKEKVNAH